MEAGRWSALLHNYFFFAGADSGAGAGADFFVVTRGRVLPNEPLKIFPLLVFLSPLPIIKTLIVYKSKGKV
jgi:hypothetical protein